MTLYKLPEDELRKRAGIAYLALESGRGTYKSFSVHPFERREGKGGGAGHKGVHGIV